MRAVRTSSIDRERGCSRDCTQLQSETNGSIWDLIGLEKDSLGASSCARSWSKAHAVQRMQAAGTTLFSAVLRPLLSAATSTPTDGAAAGGGGSCAAKGTTVLATPRHTGQRNHRAVAALGPRLQNSPAWQRAAVVQTCTLASMADAQRPQVVSSTPAARGNMLHPQIEETHLHRRRAGSLLVCCH